MIELRRMLCAIVLAALYVAPAFGQSSPGLVTGQVPTAAQWNSYFASKQDVLGFTPITLGNVVGSSPIVSTVGGGVVTISCPSCATSTLADPTGLIGMSAVNGVATSGTRSDATHAINPAIAPTWTGFHTFSVGALIGIPTDAQTGTTYTIPSADQNKLLTGTNGSAQAYSIAQGGTGGFTARWQTMLCSYGAGTITTTPGASTINGAATLATPSSDCHLITTDGTNYQAFEQGLFTSTQADGYFLKGIAVVQSNSQNFQINITANGSVTTSNYSAGSTFVMNDAVVHTGSNNFAVGITALMPGSSASSAGGSSDGALALSAQQLNYLTSSRNAEIDTIWITNYQGVNATGNTISGSLVKRANGSSQAAVQAQVTETQVDLVNGSGVGAGTIARAHSQLGQLDVANARYGFGYAMEAQVGVWDTAYLTDSSDQSAGTAGAAPSWNFLLRGRTGRSDSNNYFGVTSAGHTSGSGRIASGVFGSTITSRAQFNNNTAAPSAAGTGTIIYAVGADGANAGLEISAYGSGNFPFINYQKANGTLAGSAASKAILAGDSIGQFSFGGCDGTNCDQTGAIFTAFAGQNWSNTNHSAGKAFYSTPNGTTATAEAFRMNPSGGLSIGTTTDSGIGAVLALNGFAVGTAAKTLTLKQGANGAVGTFTCVSASNVTVTNSFIAAGDAVIVFYESGTAAAPSPAGNAKTNGTSFRVACASGDTAVYNYAIIKNAA